MAVRMLIKESLFILIKHLKLRRKKKTSNLVLTLLLQRLNGNSKRQIEAPELRVRFLCHVINLMLALKDRCPFEDLSFGTHHPHLPREQQIDLLPKWPPWKRKKECSWSNFLWWTGCFAHWLFERSTLPWRIFMNLKNVYLCRSQ